MKKYIGGWAVNKGSTYNQGYEFMFLANAKETMRKIAEGNCPKGSYASWTVTLEGVEVARGIVRR